MIDQTPSSYDQTSHRNFREQCEIYASLCGEAGIEVRPYADPSLKLFSKLSREEKRNALKAITDSVNLLSQMKHDRLPLSDSKQLLWRSMRVLGLTPRSDLFELIEGDDVVEVYSIEQKQIFRNLRYLQIVSFTLEQCYCADWRDLFERSSEANDGIARVVEDVIDGRIDRTVAFKVPTHLLRELNSEKLHQLELSLKYVSPLMSGGEIVGLVVTSQAKQLPTSH